MPYSPSCIVYMQDQPPTHFLMFRWPEPACPEDVTELRMSQVCLANTWLMKVLCWASQLLFLFVCFNTGGL